MSFLTLELAISFLKVLNRFPSNIDFSKCRREIAASLNDFSNRWCKQTFLPTGDALRVHLTLTLWVQCIVHLRSTF